MIDKNIFNSLKKIEMHFYDCSEYSYVLHQYMTIVFFSVKVLKFIFSVVVYLFISHNITNEIKTTKDRIQNLFLLKTHQSLSRITFFDIQDEMQLLFYY